MTSHGTVRSWDFEEGQGVIDSVDTPGGCRAMSSDVTVEGISVVDEEGFPSIGLSVGEAVDFEWGTDEGDDEFLHHVIAVWPSRCDPPAAIPRGAYRGSLWTVMDADVREDGIRIARQMNPADLPPVPPRGPFPRTTGTVREWNAAEGWGVIDSPATPGGAWAHFSEIRGQTGFRVLNSGMTVEFAWEAAGQDGYHFADVRSAVLRSEISGLGVPAARSRR